LIFTRFHNTLKSVEQNKMETQKITLSLPKDILLRVKLLAVQRQTSVSGLLTQALTQIVEQEEAYAHAQRRHLQLLERAFDLGTGGALKTTRDELHERS
jgi:predicted transcriptional regulator